MTLYSQAERYRRLAACYFYMGSMAMAKRYFDWYREELAREELYRGSFYTPAEVAR